MGVLIFAECDGGELRPEFWELVTVAGQLGGEYAVVVATGETGRVATEAAGAGAQVHLVEDPRLADPWPEGHAEAVATVAGAVEADLLLLPRTVLGSEVATRVAIRLGAAQLHDVTQVERMDGGLQACRPVFGGAVSAALTAPKGPFVVVPRPHAFPAAEPVAPSSAPPVSHPLTFATAPRTSPGVRTRAAPTGAPDIEKARVLVAGGNGLGGPEPFQLLGEVAGLLNGAVAASRMACDAGWVPTSLQVGLTGKTVAPDLYLAVGISGATHHLAGCASAQVIAVINNDRSAPFFKVANVGVVGDWKDILPAFRDALKEKAGRGPG
ncbi:MAG: electron transfer flavoprotein subunit alpha/FixB family protein [Dermatophilaceae bacterium]